LVRAGALIAAAIDKLQNDELEITKEEYDKI